MRQNIKYEMCRYRSSLRLSAPQNATERREMPALLPGSLRRVQAGWHCLPGPPMETLRFLLVVKVFHRIRLLHAKSIMTVDTTKQKSSVVCESCAFSFKVCAYFLSFSVKKYASCSCTRMQTGFTSCHSRFPRKHSTWRFRSTVRA